MNYNEHHQLGDIHKTVNHLDKRVTVLETRADAQAESIKAIQADVRENKDLSIKILDTLNEDTRGRVKLAWGVGVTLLAVIGTLVAVLAGG